MTPPPDAVLRLPGLCSLWTFQEETGALRRAIGRYDYTLRDGGDAVKRVKVTGAPFGTYAAELTHGNWLQIPRQECPGLNLCGPAAQVSVVAWIQRFRKPEVQCEFIAGMWNETQKKRQYGLFLDLRIHQAGDNVCGHVSSSGGPTPGYPWCMDAAIGAGYIGYFDWHCVAFTYNGAMVSAWLDGRLESRVGFNPFAYPHGIYDGGEQGADFTVGAVHRGGEMGNWFVGRIGGLAVFSRALEASELQTLTRLLPETPAPHPNRPPVLV